MMSEPRSGDTNRGTGRRVDPSPLVTCTSFSHALCRPSRGCGFGCLLGPGAYAPDYCGSPLPGLESGISKSTPVARAASTRRPWQTILRSHPESTSKCPAGHAGTAGLREDSQWKSFLDGSYARNSRIYTKESPLFPLSCVSFISWFIDFVPSSASDTEKQGSPPLAKSTAKLFPNCFGFPLLRNGLRYVCNVSCRCHHHDNRQVVVVRSVKAADPGGVRLRAQGRSVAGPPPEQVVRRARERCATSREHIGKRSHA